VTEELSEPLPELSDQLDKSWLGEEEDTLAVVEEARRGKVRAVDHRRRVGPSQRSRASQVTRRARADSHSSEEAIDKQWSGR